MSRRLDGQTAWISGAASGIGEATARPLRRGGGERRDDRHPAPIAAGPSTSDREAGGAVFLPADVSVEGQVRDSIAETAATFGGLDDHRQLRRGGPRQLLARV